MKKNNIIGEEQKEDFFKLLISGLLFVCSVLIGLFFDGVPELITILLYIAAYLICGFEVIREGIENIFHLEFFDEDFLMCVASIGAMLLGEFAEGCAVMILFKLGELFEDIASNRSRESITALMNIKPEEARVIRNGIETLCLPEEVKKGEIIVVRPGERVALDGEIIDGDGNFDMSSLTGESLPKYLAKGDNAVSGCVCLDSVCRIKACGEYSESTVARILKLVEEAQSHKSKSEKFITKFSKIYTPCVIFAALVIGIAVPLIFGLNFEIWVKKALSFLVVSCPCALVISVPLTFFSGIGGASRRGILIKGSDAIESLSKVKTVVFDKTGTLTKGEFSVVCIHPEKISESELLDIAALAESYSNHPIAQSIVRSHSGHIKKESVSEVRELAGKGIVCIVDGKKICAGNEGLMQAEGVEFERCEHTGTVVHVSENGEYMGHIVISDTVKEDSAEAILSLKELGIEKTVMLTGDAERAAEEIAKQTGIDEYRAHLMPEDKVKEVNSLIENTGNGETVMFIGDGINDAPVLALSDVGVAMGGIGSDAAVAAADVVLTDDSPKKAALAIKMSKNTMKIAKENIAFSIAVKLSVLLLAALGIAPMWACVFADVGVMVLAVANSFRSSLSKQSA